MTGPTRVSTVGAMATTTATPRVNALSVVVQDMVASLRFYRGCGLAIPDEADGEPHVDIELEGGFRLMFDTVEVVRSFDTTWEPASGGHRMALALECASPADVDATHARLVDDGHRSHLAPFDAVWGQRYAAVLDPDGNPVDFYATGAAG